jgi:DNA-binding IclR family transcriptional regulator
MTPRILTERDSEGEGGSVKTPKSEANVPPETPASTVQLRGLRAIELLANEPRTAAELARLLGINRSTSLRLLQELSSAGYVTRDSETRAYAPVASWLWGIAANTNDHADISETLAPILSRLRDEYGEAMAYAIPVGGSMVYVLYFSSHHHIALREQLGTVRPIHCSALGKAYLSGLDATSLDVELGRLDYLGGTRAGATGPLVLRRRVIESATRGYAIDAGETFEGSACVAVPVWLRDSLVGAVGCQGPSNRLSQARLDEIGQRLAVEVRALL